VIVGPPVTAGTAAIRA